MDAPEGAPEWELYRPDLMYTTSSAALTCKVAAFVVLKLFVTPVAESVVKLSFFKEFLVLVNLLEPTVYLNVDGSAICNLFSFN